MKTKKTKIKPDRMKAFKNIMRLLWYLDELHCSYCGVKFQLKNKMTSPQLDHIIPATRNGSNHISNLAPCCQKCNNAKAQKIWVVRFPNFGFGTTGVRKKEFKLDGTNYDSIIQTLINRVTALKTIPKDTNYMYYWLNGAVKHQTVENFNTPYFENKPEIMNFVNQGPDLLCSALTKDNLVAIPKKLGILDKLKAFLINLTKGRLNV